MEIMGGSPSIINNQIQSSTYFGIVTQGATTPLISGNTIDNNSSSGVSVWGGNPTISGNAIMNNTNSTNNSSGIYVSAGTPTITGNLIHHNDNGIYVSGGLPSIHNNAIYCNNIVSGSYNYGDVYYSIFTTASFMTNNAWDHYTPGPTLGYSSTSGCSAGIDICVLSTPPTANYIPFNAAVSGGCP
jgi:parallel beta-helix repeat protein